jgi:hypothetical protein
MVSRSLHRDIRRGAARYKRSAVISRGIPLHLSQKREELFNQKNNYLLGQPVRDETHEQFYNSARIVADILDDSVRGANHEAIS